MPANIQRPFSRGSFESSFTNLPRPTPGTPPPRPQSPPVGPRRPPPRPVIPIPKQAIPIKGPLKPLDTRGRGVTPRAEDLRRLAEERRRGGWKPQPRPRPGETTAKPPRPVIDTIDRPRPIPPRQPRYGTVDYPTKGTGKVKWFTPTPAERAEMDRERARPRKPPKGGGIWAEPGPPRKTYGELMPDGTVRVGHTPPKGRGRKRGQSGAGQILHIDPETGRQGTPTAADLAKMRPGRRPTRRQPVVEKFDHPTFSRGMTDTEGLLRKRARRRGPSLAEVQGSSQAILRPGGTGSDVVLNPVTPAELARLRAEAPRKRAAEWQKIRRNVPPKATQARVPFTPRPPVPKGPLKPAPPTPRPKPRRGTSLKGDLRGGPVTPAEWARMQAEDARRPRQPITPPPRATWASSPPQQPPPRRPKRPIEQAKMGPVRRGSTWDDTLRLGAPPSRWDPRSPNYVGPGPGGRRKGPIPRPKPPPRPRGPLTVIETRDRRDRPRGPINGAGPLSTPIPRPRPSPPSTPIPRPRPFPPSEEVRYTEEEVKDKDGNVIGVNRKRHPPLPWGGNYDPNNPYPDQVPDGPYWKAHPWEKGVYGGISGGWNANPYYDPKAVNPATPRPRGPIKQAKMVPRPRRRPVLQRS
jgi:hypothetical protein